jgi:hypothetical protein
MRIAYVCYVEAYRDDGVLRKIRSQVGHWRAAGHAVDLLCLSRAAAGAPAIEASVFPFGSPVERVGATLALARAAARLRPDVVYLRYDMFLPPPLRLVRRIPTVIEVNTDDQAELALRSRGAAAYNRVNRTLLLRSAAGIVCVTHELAESPGIARFGRPVAVVANGVEPPPAVLPPPAGDGPARAAFIGTPGLAWHGFDKLLWLARERPDLAFDLIGPTAADLGGGLPANVTAHGFLGREDYQQVLARADVAFGTLALDRKRMHEACPLKVRECLLYGLPMILGYRDTDFVDERPWFLLELPAREDNVRAHVGEIGAFVERVRGRRVARDEVEGRLSAEAKERQRLAFLERVASSG